MAKTEWMVLYNQYGEYRGDVVEASSAAAAIERVVDAVTAAAEDLSIVVFPMSCAIEFILDYRFVEKQ